jgi:hypothetical protein
MSHASAGPPTPSDPASGRSSPVSRPPKRPIEDGMYNGSLVNMSTADLMNLQDSTRRTKAFAAMLLESTER